VIFLATTPIFVSFILNNSIAWPLIFYRVAFCACCYKHTIKIGCIVFKYKVNVKFNLEQTTKAQKRVEV
jgi:hypothetical protein